MLPLFRSGLIGLTLAIPLVLPVSADGRIVVAHDDWTISNTGITNAPTAAQFAKNVASWFTGGGSGNFLVFSNNMGLTGASLAQAMTSAGHTWTVSTGVTFNLATLQQYDAVFLGGYVTNVVPSVLTAYVQGGGNVYVFGGYTIAGETGVFNPFLQSFGLQFESAFNGFGGVESISNSHALFSGVTGLYQLSGTSMLDTQPTNPRNQVLVMRSGKGLYAVYDGQLPPGPCIPPPGGMIGWWTGDDCQATDLLGSHDGTFAFGSSCSSIKKVGAAALSFPIGSGTYVTVPDHPALNFPGCAMSIDMWVKSDVPSGALVGKGASGNGFALGFVNGQLGFVGEDSCIQLRSSNGSTATVDLSDGAWHFVAVTLDINANVLQLYVDGWLDVSTFPLSCCALNTSGEDLLFGTNNFFPLYEGLMDEVEIFSRALDSSELDEIFEAGSAGKCKDMPMTYCTAKTNSLGCVPQIGYVGTTASESQALPFHITATNMRANTTGLLLYSTIGPAAIPFQGRFLCVAPPVKYVPPQILANSGSLPCPRYYSYNFDTRIKSGVDPSLVEGQQVWAQYWSRPVVFMKPDMTEGLTFTIGP